MVSQYKTVILALLVSLASVGQPTFSEPLANAPDQLTLTILHDNDLHGHLLPFAYTEVGRGNKEELNVGGAARRATLIRNLRKSIHNPTLLVDTGDAFTRGPLTNAYEGIADIEAMNAVGYDLAAVGNNEFKAKDGIEANDAPGAQAALLRFIKRSRFPWVCANVTDQHGAILEGVQPYVVRQIDGVRIGFLGLTAPRSGSYPQTKGWTFIDPVVAAKTWIPKARADCDILIAVTHIGVDLDKQLAAQTTGLDAIIGGDSHTFLYDPAVVANTDGVKIPIVQDGEFGVNLGRFDMTFTRGTSGTYSLTAYHDVLLPVRDKLREASDVNAVLAPYVAPLMTVAGHLSRVGATPDERTQLTSQLVADALHSMPGVDLALNPIGADLFASFHHTAVTHYDITEALPFKDIVVIADLTGDQISALAKAHTNLLAAGDISHLDPANTYHVALIDFIATSELKIPKEQLHETASDVRNVIVDYLGKATVTTVTVTPIKN